MDYEFSSQKELFMRVRPALRSKCSELKRLGYSKIKEFDIWNYLIIKKWKQAQGLMLSDIVNDIMNVNWEEINNYLEQKEEKTHSPNNDLDIIWGELHER